MVVVAIGVVAVFVVAEIAMVVGAIGVVIVFVVVAEIATVKL